MGAEKTMGEANQTELSEHMNAIDTLMRRPFVNRMGIRAPSYIPPVAKIIRETAEKYGLTPDQITGRQQKRPFAYARHEVCWRAYTEANIPLTSIGRALNYADHTTPLYAIKAHQKRMEAGR